MKTSLLFRYSCQILKPALAAVMATTWLCMPAMALESSLNGTYAGPGTGIQVIVNGGEARSNLVLNQHQEFAEIFGGTTEGLDLGGLRLTYSYTETGGNSIFTATYFEGGELLMKFVSEMRHTVITNTNTRCETRIEWIMSIESTILGDMQITSMTFDETFVFDLSNFTCQYTQSGVTVELTRTNTGTGVGQRSPILPRLINWRTPTILSFPIIDPASPLWLDPPYAGSFQYDIAAGRSERISTVILPKGFGRGIKVLAKKTPTSKPVLVGKFKSGAKINLLSKRAFRKGASSVIVRDIKPKVDLKKKAPYPLGLTFTGLSESAADVKITAKQITR